MPRFRNVRMIAAVGNSGQLGQGGSLPWHSPEDLRHFKAATMGGICVVGAATHRTLPPLPGRDVIVWRRKDDPIEFVHAHKDRDIWICGGSLIYQVWREYASQTIISHIDYDGDADRHMPLLWKAPAFVHRKQQ